MQSYEIGENDEIHPSYDFQINSLMFIPVPTNENCLVSNDDHKTFRYYAFDSFLQIKFVSLSKIQRKDKKIV